MHIVHRIRDSQECSTNASHATCASITCVLHIIPMHNWWICKQVTTLVLCRSVYKCVECVESEVCGSAVTTSALPHLRYNLCTVQNCKVCLMGAQISHHVFCTLFNEHIVMSAQSYLYTRFVSGPWFVCAQNTHGNTVHSSPDPAYS